MGSGIGFVSVFSTFMVCLFIIFLPPLSPRFIECPGTCSQHPSSPGLRSSLMTHSSLTSSALTTFSLFHLDNLFSCYSQDCSALEAFSSDVFIPKSLSLTLPPSTSLPNLSETSRIPSFLPFSL